MRSIILVLVVLFISGCVGTAESPIRDAEMPAIREFHIEAVERSIELHPGKWATMWTFNGQVPGPLIRVTEGDLVRVHFYNNHTLPHTIHFHGSHPYSMDGDDHQAVPPGGTFTYEFTAGPAGAYVYHCHVDTPTHIPRGLYGQFIVDPRGGWPGPPADAEFFVVFSDWNPRHNITAETYLFNGKAFPFTQPFQAEQDAVVRLFLSSMSDFPVAAHLHGYLPQQVWPAEHPIDVVPLAHAETRVLTFRANVPGAWMFHDHYEQHLTNDGIYPGGGLNAIEIGRDYWGAFHRLMGHHDRVGSEAETITSPAPTPPAEYGSDPTPVAVEDFEYAPAKLVVKKGTTVRWTNDGSAPHTITSTDEGGPLQSPYLKTGESFTYTFAEPGVFDYRCIPHSGRSSDGSWVGMVGTVEVIE